MNKEFCVVSILEVVEKVARGVIASTYCMEELHQTAALRDCVQKLGVLYWTEVNTEFMERKMVAVNLMWRFLYSDFEEKPGSSWGMSLRVMEEDEVRDAIE